MGTGGGEHEEGRNGKGDGGRWKGKMKGKEKGEKRGEKEERGIG